MAEREFFIHSKFLGDEKHGDLVFATFEKRNDDGFLIVGNPDKWYQFKVDAEDASKCEDFFQHRMRTSVQTARFQGYVLDRLSKFGNGIAELLCEIVAHY